MKIALNFFPAFVNSLGFVFKKHLYFYFLPAILLSLLFYFMLSGAQSATNWLSFMEDWWVIGWIIGALEKTIHVISFVAFEFVILVLLTPINSYFAEKVKEDETGTKADFNMAQLFRSLGRSIKIFAIAFSVEMVSLFFIWILSFILGDMFYYVSATLISSFFLGFSFFDFGLDLEKISSKDSWKWGKSNFILCLVVGLIFSFSIYIPEQSGYIILFIVSISFVPHLLTIAATKVYYKSIKNADSIINEPANDVIDTI